MISSRVKSTAAIGVLNAAESAAAPPTGTSHFTCALLRPRRRAITDASPGADVHRRAFAAEWNSARKRDGAADELADHRSQRDPAVVNENSGARLRNSAPARQWEIPIEEISRDERAECRHENATPPGAAGGIHVRGQTPREQDECDDDESNEGADHQAQHECEAIFLTAKILDQTQQSGANLPHFRKSHGLKLHGASVRVERCENIGLFPVAGGSTTVDQFPAVPRTRVTRQIVFPTSSATSSDPVLSIATPTGRPIASPFSLMNPPRTSVGGPAGLPPRKGTKITL